ASYTCFTIQRRPAKIQMPNAHQSETLMYPDAGMLEGGKMRTVLRRPSPAVGRRSSRDTLLVALAVVTVVAVIASGAADAFLHGGDQATAARAAASTGAPAAAEAAGGAPVAESGILPAPSPATAVAPAGVQTVGARPHAAARPAAAMPMAMPPAPAAEPAMPTPNVTTVKDGPLPVLPSLLGQPFDLVGGVPLVAGLPVLTSP